MNAIDRCEGWEWMEQFDRKLVDLTCREILTIGKNGSSYILRGFQTGKTLLLTNGVLAFFSFALQTICKFGEIFHHEIEKICQSEMLW